MEKDNHPAGAATSRDPITRPTTVANAQSFVILEERDAKREVPIRSREVKALKNLELPGASGSDRQRSRG